MTREQELHFALQEQLSLDQIMMVSELLAVATGVSIEDRIEAQGWDCPGCGWPWPDDHDAT